jgi:hypothetical protein
MYFCEPVSFAAGGVLVVGGAFAGWKAFKINKQYFPVSQMPSLAGLQPFMEGHVWMGEYLRPIHGLVGRHGLYLFLLADLAGLGTVQHLFWNFQPVGANCRCRSLPFLAGLGALHLIYIIVWNKCCCECPELFR